MATTFTWKIVQLDRETADGFVVLVDDAQLDIIVFVDDDLAEGIFPVAVAYPVPSFIPDMAFEVVAARQPAEYLAVAVLRSGKAETGLHAGQRVGRQAGALLDGETHLVLVVDVVGHHRDQPGLFGLLRAAPNKFRFGVKPDERFERKVTITRPDGQPFEIRNLTVGAPQLMGTKGRSAGAPW